MTPQVEQRQQTRAIWAIFFSDLTVSRVVTVEIMHRYSMVFGYDLMKKLVALPEKELMGWVDYHRQIWCL